MATTKEAQAGFQLAERLCDHVKRMIGAMDAPILLVAGSTVRGDFLEGWSDLDILVPDDVSP